MVLTIRELLIAVDSGALKRLSAQPIPAVGAWRLRRILRLMGAEYDAANAGRLSLITDDNSVPVNGGSGRMVKPEYVRAFEADPLFSAKVTIDAEPLTLDMISGASLSADDLDLIAPLLSTTE